MISVAQDVFVKGIRPGDIGLILGDNMFAKLQNLYRNRFKEGPLQASHGFFVRQPPAITEANGAFVSDATFLKNIGDKTKTWFFRYPGITPAQLGDMDDYVDGMVDAGGHYSVGGIMQFGLKFFGIHKKLADEGGVFCTELTGRTILKGGLPYITTMKPFEVTPSLQLNWFMTGGSLDGWQLAAFYDGKGGYFLKEESQDGPDTNTKAG